MGNPGKIFDGLLVLQYQSGNKKALALLVKRHHPKLCKHAFWYTHDLDISQDIVQDCWTQIMRKIGSLRDPNSFGSWALRIVTRKSLDYLNRASRERNELRSIDKTKTLDYPAVDRASDLENLRAAIKELPDSQQQVLHLFYTEAYSLKEISAILEIAPGTVKSRLYHAREKLKTILKK
ncbi:MAG: RNA polymerase sigma factor [Flavobacteriaceae bacterium]